MGAPGRRRNLIAGCICDIPAAPRIASIENVVGQPECGPGFEARAFRLCISRFQAMPARRDDKRDGSYFVAPTAASTIVVTHWI